MRRKAIMIAAFGVGLTFAAAPASADYMSDCDELIGAWKRCQSSSGDCSAQRQAIVEKCKCHRFQAGEWRLVMSAVGADGVCEPDWPEDTPPVIEDPSPPRPGSPERPHVAPPGGEVRLPAAGQRGAN